MVYSGNNIFKYPNLWFLGNEGKKIGEYLGDGVDSKLKPNQTWIMLSKFKEKRGCNVLVNDLVVCQLCIKLNCFKSGEERGQEEAEFSN